MKRIINVIIVICILVFISIVSYILLVEVSGNKSKKFDKTIGIVTTTQYEYKSKIYWYDENLNYAGTTKLPYAGLGSYFTNPVYDKDKIYLIPRGLWNRKDTKKVISISKKDLSITEYPFEGIYLLDTAVIDDIVYTTNTGIRGGWVEAYNNNTKVKKDFYLKKEYIRPLIACEDKLLVFSRGIFDKKRKITLNVLDKELNILQKIDMTDYGDPQSKYYIDKDYIYITSARAANDEKLSRIIKISKKDFSLSYVEGAGLNPNDIYIYKDKIIVSDICLPNLDGDSIVGLNKDGKVEFTKKLNTYPKNIAIYKDKLIVSNNEKVQLYDLKTFKLEKEQEIQLKRPWYGTAIILR